MDNQKLIEEIKNKYRTVEVSTDEFYISTDYELKFGDYLTVYVREIDGNLVLLDYCQIREVFDAALQTPKITSILQENDITLVTSCLMKTCKEIDQVDIFIKSLKTIIDLCNEQINKDNILKN